MVDRFVKEGSRLEISQKVNESTRTYTSKVEEILKNDEILVYEPISYGVVVTLSQGRTYTFVFFTDGNIYRATGVITGRYKRENLGMLKVRMNNDFDKIQRRQFFRFNCLIDFKFTQSVVDRKTESSDAPEEMQDGVVKDICGGGIRFATNEQLDTAKMIRCLIPLDNTYVNLYSKILYLDRLQEGNYRYEYRAKFINITSTEQEYIVQYIFDEQRKLLQKQRATSSSKPIKGNIKT